MDTELGTLSGRKEALKSDTTAQRQRLQGRAA